MINAMEIIAGIIIFIPNSSSIIPLNAIRQKNKASIKQRRGYVFK